MQHFSGLNPDKQRLWFHYKARLNLSLPLKNRAHFQRFTWIKLSHTFHKKAPDCKYIRRLWEEEYNHTNRIKALFISGINFYCCPDAVVGIVEVLSLLSRFVPFCLMLFSMVVELTILLNDVRLYVGTFYHDSLLAKTVKTLIISLFENI